VSALKETNLTYLNATLPLTGVALVTKAFQVAWMKCLFLNRRRVMLNKSSTDHFTTHKKYFIQFLACDKDLRNRVFRRIFEPKREEDGSWRKMHNDELHGLYSSPNIVRVIK
jgi:hypothetical protein